RNQFSGDDPHDAKNATFSRPIRCSRCSRTASPKPATDNESPIMSTFGGGGGGADCFWRLLANTKEPMTTRKLSENETERIIGDQSFLPRRLGVSGFRLDTNIGLRLDPVGVVVRLYCSRSRALQ